MEQLTDTYTTDIYFGRGMHQQFKTSHNNLVNTLPNEIDEFPMNEFDPIYQSDDDSSNEIEPKFILNDPDIYKSFCEYTKGCVILQRPSQYEAQDWTKEALFPGSKLIASHLFLILEMIKTTQSLGDIDESIILGILASVLPEGNLISEILNQTSQTSYYFQDIIKKGHQALYKCGILRIQVCRNGCVVLPVLI